MKILTWTVGLHFIFQFVPVTSEVGGGLVGSNKWGRACDSNCPSNCRPTNNIVYCNCTTKECLGGCNVGYHGTTCRRQCHSNCINNTCNHIDGECTSGCKDNTSCTVTAPPTNKPDTDITQTQCDFTCCLGCCVSLAVVTVCAVVGGSVVYAIWHRRRGNKRADEEPGEDSVRMGELVTIDSD